MGKQLRRIDYGSVHHQSPGGCFGGMFHVLHHKKHHGRRRLLCFAAPKTVSFSFHGGEEHVDDDDSERLLGEHRVDQDNPQKPSSSKETSSKNRKHQRRNSSITSNQTNQIMIFHENVDDPYICFEEHSNVRFTKARSFPFPDSSSRRYRPSTMNHKQNEVWFFKKVEPMKVVTLETHKDDSKPNSKEANHGWNHLIKSQFKGFKKIIKRAIRETRKETKEAKKEELTKEKKKVQQMTRLSSLNESADKYARLFNRSFSSNATSNFRNSNSLKLTSEDDTVGGDVVKSYRRRHSLPDYETLISLLGEVSQETLYSGLLAWTKSEMEKSKESRPSFDIRPSFEQMAESASRSGADLGIETDHCQETVFQSGKTEAHFIFDDEKIAAVEDEAVDQAAFMSFEGAELASCSSPNFTDSIKEIDPDFNFVSNILKSAGFFETEPIPPWDSIELPLNAQLLDQPEAPKSHHHQLLFDLINEALLEIYERSFSNFPMPISFSPYTRPITKGTHVIDEVWKTVRGWSVTRRWMM